MTLSYHEVIRVVCDDCGDLEEESLNPEISSLTFDEMEISFYWDLVHRGWKSIKDRDLHFCPDCVKNPDSEYHDWKDEYESK
jgi:hypothetical protein